MRILLPLLIVLIGCGPTAAQTAAKVAAAKPKPAAAAAPAPVPAPAKGVYAAMPDAERMAIQSDLIWTGDYNGMVGAEFSDRAVAAVKSFQKRNSGKETGILNPDERAKLGESAKAKREHVGWRLVEDAATGARLGIPGKLVPQSAPGKSGSHWQSGHGEVQIDTFRVAAPGTTLAAVFEQQRKEPAERKVEYNVLRPDFFVISGLQGLKKFYVRGQVRDNEVRGLTILYDQAMEGILDPVAVAMSSAFAAFPGTLANAGPPPRRKVEYGTGLVVSAAGDIVTDVDLVTDCELIVVPGFGHAERVAADTDTALALLRLNGAQGLAPVVIADSGFAGTGADITLVGIADPQAQNGGNAVSTTRGRLAGSGNSATIDPAPAAGFAGAAALDRDGGVAGIVGMHPSATASGAAIVPAPTIAKFLAAQNVAAATGRAGIDGVKAAAVRVICVRK